MPVCHRGSTQESDFTHCPGSECKRLVTSVMSSAGMPRCNNRSRRWRFKETMHSLTQRVLDSPLSPLLLWVPFAFLTVLKLWLWNGETRRRIETQPWWLMLCWILGGLAFDWRCAINWFAGRFSARSAPVFYRAGLIAIGCAAAAFAMVWLTSRARRRHAPAFFLIASCAVWSVVQHI